MKGGGARDGGAVYRFCISIHSEEKGAREGGSVILNFLFTSRDENNRSRSGLVRIMHRGAAAATEDGDKIYRKVARHCSLSPSCRMARVGMRNQNRKSSCSKRRPVRDRFGEREKGLICFGGGPITIYHPSRSPPISLDSARCPSSLTRSSSMAYDLSLFAVSAWGFAWQYPISASLDAWTVFMTFTFTEISLALVILSSPLSGERANFAKTQCSSNRVYAFAGMTPSLSLCHWRICRANQIP